MDTESGVDSFTITSSPIGIVSGLFGSIKLVSREGLVLFTELVSVTPLFGPQAVTKIRRKMLGNMWEIFLMGVCLSP